ncbi:MAG: transposase [Rhodospirillales bacterium]
MASRVRRHERPARELVADKCYDSKALREWLEERGTTAVIPPRKNRKVQYDCDKAVYRQSNIIERMFCRLKDWRRIATRLDRNIRNFLAAVALAAVALAANVIWWL